MDYYSKYLKYKNKYLELKQKNELIGGSLKKNKVSFDGRIIENCYNLCYNNSVIHLFYSIPEFREKVEKVNKINNINLRVFSSKVKQVDINDIFNRLKEIFKLMNKKNKASPNLVNDNIVICDRALSDFYNNIYKKFLIELVILAYNNKGGRYDNSKYQIVYGKNKIMDTDEQIPRLINNDFGFLHHTLHNFLVCFSDLLKDIFTYYIHPKTKELIFTFYSNQNLNNIKMLGEKINVKFNKYIIFMLNEEDFDADIFINNSKYVFVAQISTKWIIENNQRIRGGHFWLDIYDYDKDKFTRIDDLKKQIQRNVKFNYKTEAAYYIIYQKSE